MAKNPFKPWRRNRPPSKFIPLQDFRIPSYPDTIGLIGDFTHPNSDIQNRLHIIDTTPDDNARILGDIGLRTNALLTPSHEDVRHTTPMLWATRGIRVFWGGKGNLAGRSGSVVCRRCGKEAPPKQMHEVLDHDNPDNPSGIAYEHNTDWGGCPNFDTEGRPWGAKRSGRY